MISPTAADSPFFLRTRAIFPDSGAGSSTVAFSLSKLTTGSSFFTLWPSLLSQSPISTSVMDSPTSGIFSSMRMWVMRDASCVKLLESAGYDFSLFLFMAFVRSDCGRGRGRPRDPSEGKAAKKIFSQLTAQESPRAHVGRLFLNPEHLRAFLIIGQ